MEHRGLWAILIQSDNDKLILNSRTYNSLSNPLRRYGQYVNSLKVGNKFYDCFARVVSNSSGAKFSAHISIVDNITGVAIFTAAYFKSQFNFFVFFCQITIF